MTLRAIAKYHPVARAARFPHSRISLAPRFASGADDSLSWNADSTGAHTSVCANDFHGHPF